jgi:hypothetical protein
LGKKHLPPFSLFPSSEFLIVCVLHSERTQSFTQDRLNRLNGRLPSPKKAIKHVAANFLVPISKLNPDDGSRMYDVHGTLVKENILVHHLPTGLHKTCFSYRTLKSTLASSKEWR